MFINYSDFEKVDLRVGKVLKVEDETEFLIPKDKIVSAKLYIE